MRFALIGAGNIAKIYVDALAQIPGASIAVVCNRTEASGRALAEKAGAAWLPRFEDAVARADVDAVIAATPSGTHMEIAQAGAQAGKHLLIEKPLDITLARVDAMIAAAQQAGVILACVFPQRFTDGAHVAKAALDAGRLGRLTFCDAVLKWHRPQSYYDGSWRGTWALDGGGALMNQAIHFVDLLQWLAGPVAAVQGMTGTLAHSMETEDTAGAVLQFVHGGLGMIQAATSSWPGDPARVALHGDRGTIKLEEGRIVQWDLADAEEGEQDQLLGEEASGGSGAGDPMAIGFEKHRRQLVDFIQAVETGTPPAVDGTEARKSVEIIRAIYRSAAQGKRVTLPLGDDAG
ncbi:MAG: Gfo/Idh/MocA family oxidoreductase [Litorilinea sp.]